MYKALKDFAWSINFKKVVFTKDEEFEKDKVGNSSILKEMIEKKYVEEVKETNIGDSEQEILQKMSNKDLIDFAKKTFGVEIKGTKEQLIAQIEKLADEYEKQSNDNNGDENPDGSEFNFN